LNYTEHNPSATITYKPSEVIDIVKWVWENQAIIGGLTFLPSFDAQYDQMPYEEISEQEYNTLAQRFPNIDFSKIFRYEESDLTTASQELACMGGHCEM
jgi:ribonucleoside-diphosphate reductase alpha chain